MADVKCAVLHRENVRTCREDSLWLDEVRRWQVEHQWVTAWLRAVESAWSEAEAKLNAHADAIRAHEKRLREHEEAIGYSWWHPSNVPEGRFLAEHQELEAKHREMRKVHEEIQQLHQEVTEEMRELLRTLLAGALVQEWGPIEPE